MKALVCALMAAFVLVPEREPTATPNIDQRYANVVPAHRLDLGCHPFSKEGMMPERRIPDFEVVSDGRTVWVNGADGMCLGRFGPVGIDIHRDFAAQARGESECLACTHEKPDIKAWRQFQILMRRHYAVGIGDDHMPRFVREEL